MKLTIHAYEPEETEAMLEIMAVWKRATDKVRARRADAFDHVSPAEQIEAPSVEAEIVEPAKKRGRPKKVVVDTIEETFDVDLAPQPAPEPAVEAEDDFEPPKFLKPEAPAPEPEAEEQPEALEPEEAVTIETVRSAFLELSARRSPEAVIELLSRYGARKASDVPEDKRFAIVREARALIDG